jgi:uncharacterized protein YdeI (YjbR/CyaY-like superfamily)
MGKFPDHCIVFANRDEWRAWLEENPVKEQKACLLIGRKGATRQFLMLNEAVEEALCFGWIDEVLRPISIKKPIPYGLHPANPIVFGL